MVYRRIEIVTLLLLMTLLLISSLADAQRLNRDPSKEGSNMVGRDARFECPNGCCGIFSPYCRCCPNPNTHNPTNSHT
ncbi:hypothetical protein AAHA92_20024 [Salvia divinorum]|uniref:Uncharacterized protein n=1 Tax=Salvia divinorum TaxID=28513 RepID=A0ABD1GGD3_SALDI